MDIKKGCGDTGGEQEGGMHWESRTDIYTLPCAKQISSG